MAKSTTPRRRKKNQENPALDFLIDELNLEPVSSLDSSSDEPDSILSAFVYLTRMTVGEGHDKCMRLDTSDCPALHYLMRRLDLTASQVHLLVCIAYYCQRSACPCDRNDIAGYYSCHPFECIVSDSDIRYLTNHGYIHFDPMLDGGWRITDEAMQALRDNHPFDVKTLRSPDPISFLTACSRAIHGGVRHDNDNRIIDRLHFLFALNADMPIASLITKYGSRSEADFKALVVFAAIQGGDGDQFISSMDLDMLLTSRETHMFMRACNRGTHPFVRDEIIEPYCSDGLATADRFVLTRKAWMEFLGNDEDAVAAICGDTESWGKNLTLASSIAERPLYFSGNTQVEVDRLRELLHDEQYRRVVNKLRERNMPTGLNILLYGTPGTGKTELVQQLARETGRDLLVVDMSQIRDKYVGESEKNLSQIFATYRDYVRRLDRAPILFCNECDAIFGARMEKTTQAVDKMENSMQNILLQEMEKLEGIMICTTNLTSTLDKAFERRFLMKLNLPKPGNEARKAIWASMLPGLTDEQAADLAVRFDFSGGQIQNISRKQLINSIFTGSDSIDYDRILVDCQAETFDRSNGHRVGF